MVIVKHEKSEFTEHEILDSIYVISLWLKSWQEVAVISEPSYGLLPHISQLTKEQLGEVATTKIKPGEEPLCGGNHISESG